MTIRLVPLSFAALLTLTAFVAVAPAASALASDTTTQVAITPYETPIRPLSGIAPLTINIDYCFTAGVGLVPTAISLSVAESPPWAVASISPATVFINVLDTGGTPTGATVCRTASSRMLVSTTADAPAFSPANVRVTAASAVNGDLKASSGQDQTLITADFFSIVDAAAATTIQIARPQTQVAFPITVTNFGNANTKLLFEITSKPEGRWQVQEPIPITLEARQQGGKQTSANVNLNILTPYHNGYLNEVGAITMRITSNYALDTKVKGDTTQVSVITTTKGFYVPGFEALGALAAIGALALVVRRRS